MQRLSQTFRILVALAAGLAVSIGTWMQSAFKVPSIPTMASGYFGTSRPTRSPHLAPGCLECPRQLVAKPIQLAIGHGPIALDQSDSLRTALGLEAHPFLQEIHHSATFLIER